MMLIFTIFLGLVRNILLFGCLWNSPGEQILYSKLCFRALISLKKQLQRN